jgi:hypothetical protein
VPSLPSRISLAIPEADLPIIQGAIQTLQEKLLPCLVDLNTEERVGLAKMGAKTLDFVTKTLAYAQTNPQWVPTFVDVAEFERDLAGFHTLRELFQPISQIADMVEDSMMLSGAEALGASLATYQSVKLAAKQHQPGAEVIATDLAVRFPKRSMRRSEPPPAPLPPAAS